MRNIVIFGGSGFVGRHYRNYIKEKFPAVNVLSLDIKPDSESLFVDVREQIEIAENFGLNDIIINLAAVHKTPGHPDYDYFETNIRGAENVCQFAEKHNISKIIFTSSIAPYGAAEEEKKESTLPQPNTPYGISKLVAEHIHKEWQASLQGRRLLILRPGVIFGKGENGNFTRLYHAIRKKRFFYPGRKDTIKACIYVKDLIQLSFQIFESYDEGSRIYNFAYAPGKSIEDIVSTMCKVAGLKAPKLLISGHFLIFAARMIHFLGGGRMGIHPDRVKKLMISTNINGQKILNDKFNFDYTLESAIIDWLSECGDEELC